MNFFEPEQNPFKTVYVDITHRCQMACANCYLPNRTVPDMDNEKFLDCIRRFPKKTDLRLVGGEPTLRSDLPEIVNKIIEIGHRPVLITNGLRLAKSDFAKALAEAGLQYAQISLNGFKYDKIYQLTDQMTCAEEKMKAIQNCVQFGIAPSLSCILIRDINTQLADELIDFAETLPKPARINFRNVGAIGRNMTSQVKSLTMNEMVDLVAKKLNVPAEEIKSHKTADNQIRYLSKKNQRYSQQVIVKITDWSIFQEPVLKDPKAMERGRITQDFKLAPHFEHVKANEFGY